MSNIVQSFKNNRLYELLISPSVYTIDNLNDINSILHEQPELASLTDPIHGSYFHILCQKTNEQENIAYRMIYALSNAGANPNVVDENGNTSLHAALTRDFIDIGLDFIQALFRIGVDSRTVNKQGKTADTYINENNAQLISLYEGYGDGIWKAVETNNIHETDRLVRGFIKIDCKNSSNQTLLDLARQLNSSEIIRILADYQVTIEFLHSILAFDWQRVQLIQQHENSFIKINLDDSLHRLTWLRATNRSYSKSLLEFCLETNSPTLFEILFQSDLFKSKIDVNCYCTDGLPFFFHMFQTCFTVNMRRFFYSQADFSRKSCQGETFLFHLIHLYIQNENGEYLQIFDDILRTHSLLLTYRNEKGRTIIEELELTPTSIYDKLRPFYQSIQEILLNHIKNNSNIERYIFHGFAYHLYYLYRDEIYQTNKMFKELFQSIQIRQGLTLLMNDLVEAVANNDLARMQKILKMKSNIYLAQDWAGRTIAHLAVLHRRKTILNFICEDYRSILNLKDNLDRTPLHYAYIMNDNDFVNILRDNDAKKTFDCFRFLPNDYKLNRDLCSEEFYAFQYPKNELEKRLDGISDYLKMNFYSSIKKSIEDNSVEDLKAINQQMNAMGFRIEDFNRNSYVNDWIQGQRYIPLLFLALEHRFIAIFQYLISLGLPIEGRMYMPKTSQHAKSRCVSFRTRAEELECFDIIGMINDLEDDNELKHIFKRHLSPSTTHCSQSSTDIEQQTKKQKLPTDQTSRNDPIKSPTCIIL